MMKMPKSTFQEKQMKRLSFFPATIIGVIIMILGWYYLFSSAVRSSETDLMFAQQVLILSYVLILAGVIMQGFDKIRRALEVKSNS